MELVVAPQAAHFPSWEPCSLHKDGASREWSISCGESKDTGSHSQSPWGSDFPLVAWTWLSEVSSPSFNKAGRSRGEASQLIGRWG